MATAIERNKARLQAPDSDLQRAQSVGAVNKTLCVFTPKIPGVYAYNIWAQAMLDDGTAGAWFAQRGAFRVAADLAVTILATPVVEGVAEAGTGLANTDLHTNNGAGKVFQVYGAGIGGKTLDWSCILEVWQGLSHKA